MNSDFRSPKWGMCLALLEMQAHYFVRRSVRWRSFAQELEPIVVYHFQAAEEGDHNADLLTRLQARRTAGQWDEDCQEAALWLRRRADEREREDESCLQFHNDLRARYGLSPFTSVPSV